MPDWLDVDAAQTAVLIFATALAYLTYRTNRRDRWNQNDERHLLRVADSIAELAAAAEELKWGDRSGERKRFFQAQKRLVVAVQFVEAYNPQLETCSRLIEAAPDHASEITDVLAPIAAGEVADVLHGLPQGPWYLPRWIRRLLSIEWRRSYSIRVEQPLRRFGRWISRRKDDDDVIRA